MSSKFAERLDFLMSLTNTTNSALARELSFDASYISRIRSGKRGVPLHQPFVEPAASYLSGKIREPYQIQAVEQALNLPGRWPGQADQDKQLIATWLSDDSSAFDTRFERLFAGLAAKPASLSHAGATSKEGTSAMEGDGRAPRRGEKATRADAYGNNQSLDTGKAANQTLYFFGNEGKRKATELFLGRLAKSGKPHTLLLYSDEPMEWLVEDGDFAQRWAASLLELIAHGSRIIIIHTVTRDIGEMLDAVQNWLPLYLTGHVESYYCPRIRDGIFNRTLFIAQGCQVLTSSSVAGDSRGMTNAFTNAPEVVAASEREFDNLMSLCRLLVKVRHFTSDEELARFLAQFADEGPAYLAYNPDSSEGTRHVESASPSVPTRPTTRLPEHVLALVNENAGFVLVRLGDPDIAIHVTERLMTASFNEFLR